LELRDFAPHEDQPVSYSLRDGEGFEVSSGSEVVSGGTLTFTAAGAVASTESYDLYFFADFDMSGSCSAPPADHAWALNGLSTDGNGDLDVSYEHGVDFTDVCEFFRR